MWISGTTLYEYSPNGQVSSQTFPTVRAVEDAYRQKQTRCSSTTVCFPVPGSSPTPTTQPTTGQINLSQNLGWNAGATSVHGVQTNGGFSCKVGVSSAGVMLGLSSLTLSVEPGTITHGFYFSGRILSIVEGGSVKVSNLVYSDGDSLQIIRAGGRVAYFRNQDRLLTSNVTSLGVVHLKVLLYAAGDYVYNPSVISVQNLSCELTSSTKFDFSGDLRCKGSAVSSLISQIRKGADVDLQGKLSSVSSGQSSLIANLLLSAKGD
jgi:hypothetical protein